MPERIQRQRSKGWKMPANTVYVGRPTKWGNPFKVGDLVDGIGRLTAEGAVLCFDAYILMGGGGNDITELRGKNLACWCKPGEPCHVDVLLEAANA